MIPGDLIVTLSQVTLYHITLLDGAYSICIIKSRAFGVVLDTALVDLRPYSRVGLEVMFNGQRGFVSAALFTDAQKLIIDARDINNKFP